MKYIRRLQVQYKKQVKSLGIMVWPHATDRPMTDLVARWDRYPFYNRWPAIPEFSMIHHTLCKNEILRYPFFYQSMNALFSTSWIKPECPMRKEQLDWNHSISTITSLWVLSSPAFLMPTRYHTSPRCSLFFSFYVVLSFGCIIILGLCSLRSCLLLGPLCCFPSLLLMENGWSCFFFKKKYREHLI